MACTLSTIKVSNLQKPDLHSVAAKAVTISIPSAKFKSEGSCIKLDDHCVQLDVSKPSINNLHENKCVKTLRPHNSHTVCHVEKESPNYAKQTLLLSSLIKW